MPTLPLPEPPVSICELIPMTRPVASSSGPPELPGLIAASVCRTLSIAKPFGRLDLALQRRDDAGGERAFQAERVADRDRRVADLDGLGVAERAAGGGRARRCRRAARRGRSSGSLPTISRVDRLLVGELDGDLASRPRRRGALVRIVPSPSITKPEPVASPALLGRIPKSNGDVGAAGRPRSGRRRRRARRACRCRARSGRPSLARARRGLAPAAACSTTVVVVEPPPRSTGGDERRRRRRAPSSGGRRGRSGTVARERAR